MRHLLLAAAVVLALTATAGLLPSSPVSAQAPKITYQFPQEGDVLKEQPPFFQFCFAQPIDIRDKDKGGAFDFTLTQPGNLGLGMRVAFQVDGYGVAVYPGAPVDPTKIEGQWKLQFTVRDASSLQTITQTVDYSIDSQNGKAVSHGTAQPCVAGATATASATPQASGRSPGASPAPGASPSPAGSPGPGASPAPGGSPTASPSGGQAAQDQGGGPDILELALITVGAAGGAAVLGLVGYLVRRRVGFWLHRPPPRDGGGGAEHH